MFCRRAWQRVGPLARTALRPTTTKVRHMAFGIPSGSTNVTYFVLCGGGLTAAAVYAYKSVNGEEKAVPAKAPAVEAVPEPVVEVVSEPAPATEPEPEPAPEAEPASKPFTEPAPEPVAETASEPAPEPVAETAPEPAPELVAETAAEPVVEAVVETALAPEVAAEVTAEVAPAPEEPVTAVEVVPAEASVPIEATAAESTGTAAVVEVPAPDVEAAPAAGVAA